MTEGQIVETGEDYVFNSIPSLTELLPTTGGIPGIQYAQVCVHNLKKGQNDGWQRIQGAKVYTILGAGGRADMELLAKGKAIIGQSPDAGARRCWIDEEVYGLTGHINPKSPKETDGGAQSQKAEVKKTH